MATKKIKRDQMQLLKSKKEALDAHFISTEIAKTMINRADYQEPVHFSAKAIRVLLETPGCEALRVYKGKSYDGRDTIVLTPVNKYYDDLRIKRKKKVSKAAKGGAGDDEGALDMGQSCPAGYSGPEQQRIINPPKLINQ